MGGLLQNACQRHVQEHGGVLQRNAHIL